MLKIQRTWKQLKVTNGEPKSAMETCSRDDGDAINKASAHTESQKHCVIGENEDNSITSAQLTDGLKETIQITFIRSEYFFR